MDAQFEQVKELAQQLASAREEKKVYEDKIKDINSTIKNLEETKLNNLMLELGISKVSLDDMDISRSVVFRGGYTKHSDPEAFQFLYDSHNDGALKKHIIVDLEAYPRAGLVLEENGIKYTEEYSIHHATLSSIIKELVEAGQFTTDDIDKYSVYVQPQIKVKRTGETE